MILIIYTVVSHAYKKNYQIFSKLSLWTFLQLCLVTWPLNESEAGGDLVMIETSLLLEMLIPTH